MNESEFKRLHLQEFPSPLLATYKGVRGCAELQQVASGRFFVRFVADPGQGDGGITEARLSAGSSKDDAWRIAAEKGLELTITW